MGGRQRHRAAWPANLAPRPDGTYHFVVGRPAAAADRLARAGHPAGRRRRPDRAAQTGLQAAVRSLGAREGGVRQAGDVKSVRRTPAWRVRGLYENSAFSTLRLNSQANCLINPQYSASLRYVSKLTRGAPSMNGGRRSSPRAIRRKFLPCALAISSFHRDVDVETIVVISGYIRDHQKGLADTLHYGILNVVGHKVGTDHSRHAGYGLDQSSHIAIEGGRGSVEIGRKEDEMRLARVAPGVEQRSKLSLALGRNLLRIRWNSNPSLIRSAYQFYSRISKYEHRKVKLLREFYLGKEILIGGFACSRILCSSMRDDRNEGSATQHYLVQAGIPLKPS